MGAKGLELERFREYRETCRPLREGVAAISSHSPATDSHIVSATPPATGTFLVFFLLSSLSLPPSRSLEQGALSGYFTTYSAYSPNYQPSCITSTDHTLLSRLYPHHQHDAITLTKVTTPIEHPESWVFCWARSTRAVQRLRTSAQWLWPTHTVSPDSTAGPQCLEITHFPADHMTRYIRATTSRMRALNASSAHVDQ